MPAGDTSSDMVSCPGARSRELARRSPSCGAPPTSTRGWRRRCLHARRAWRGLFDHVDRSRRLGRWGVSVGNTRQTTGASRPSCQAAVMGALIPCGGKSLAGRPVHSLHCFDSIARVQPLPRRRRREPTNAPTSSLGESSCRRSDRVRGCIRPTARAGPPVTRSADAGRRGR